jgi:sugar (pentulose or hexulose) kinase
VLEGLAFAARDVIDRLRVMKLATDRVLLLGGGARSDVWSQIRADATGLPHQTAAAEDTCPIGAAMIASVAAGIHDDLAAAAAHVPAPRDIAAPARSLDEPYQRYRTLVTQLAALAVAPWR